MEKQKKDYIKVDGKTVRRVKNPKKTGRKAESAEGKARMRGIATKLTEAEYQMISEFVERSGMNMNKFVREACLSFISSSSQTQI